MSDKPADNQERRELLRLSVLLEAYRRRPHEFPMPFIKQKLRTFMGHPLSDDEVEAEVQFVTDKGYLLMRFEELGATKHFRISAEGVVLMEREYPHHVREL
jgi:hypothetical protein